MKKILVTTDFSAASKAGMRFAIQMATQMEVELVFFHCFHALIPSTIHRDHIKNSLQEQSRFHQQQLEHFVEKLHRSMHVQPGRHRCVVVEHLNPEQAVLEYAHANDFQFICMSTRGAGSILKIIGTHTGNVLHRSTVPVLVVPHRYRVRKIKKVLYASDLENIDLEMSKVAGFAEALQVKADLAHFYFPGEIRLSQEHLKQMWQMKYPQLDQLYLEQYDFNAGFPAQLDLLCKKIRPSIVVFFSHTKKTWFDKFFGHSTAESVSFVTKVPMLVFRKIGS
ncbi:MAG: universal stress protein [Bacteroidales bacterium]|nr:universal stress protein [Bacteroidales bacterium]